MSVFLALGFRPFFLLAGYFAVILIATWVPFFLGGFAFSNSYPLSLILQADYGQLLHYAGRSEDGLREIEEALRLDPTFVEAHNLAAEIYLAQGRLADALEALSSARRLGGMSLAEAPEVAIAGPRRGSLDDSEWRAGLTLTALARAQHEDGELGACHALAQIAVVLGDPSTALLELEHLVRKRAGVSILFGVQPLFRPLLGEPAFGELLEAIWGRGRVPELVHG